MWIPLDQKTPYQIYSKEANWIERMFDYSSKKELSLLKEFGVFNSKNNSKGVVRDHKYSRYSGFKNKINPILLRHPENCEIILNKNNISKAKKNHRYEDGDSITLEQLFLDIINFKKEWKEQEICLNLIKEFKMKNGGILLVGDVK